MESKEYTNLIQSKSRELLANDCETILDVIIRIHDPVFISSIIPFYSLFCSSACEYLGYSNTDVDLSKIKMSRDKLKLTQNRYREISNTLSGIDQNTDDEFKQQNLLSILSGDDGYYNLGIFFDVNYNIVSNSQMSTYLNNIDKLFDDDIKGKCIANGENISSMICKIFMDTREYCTCLNTKLRHIPQIPYCMDVNTNKEGFFKNNYSKEINLLMLDMLCNLNFVDKVLLPSLPNENLWGFRVKYISLHYSFLGFKKLILLIPTFNKFFNKNEFLQLQENTFKSRFRNCMMHYDLIYNNVPSIDEQYFDEGKPFFGLIESCFNGISFDEYSKKLDIIMNHMIEFLVDNFAVNYDYIEENN